MSSGNPLLMHLPLLLQGVGVQGDQFFELDIFDAQVVDEISEDPLHREKHISPFAIAH